MSAKSKKRVTLGDLGKILNLSKRAVSQALKDGESTARISEATRQRVRALAAELEYRPNRSARILRMGRSGAVGIMTVQSLGPVIQEQLFHAREQAVRHGLIPNIYLLPHGGEASCTHGVDVMLDANVDGLLVFGNFIHYQVARLRKIGLPVVAVGNPMLDSVIRYHADKEVGFYQLTRHLIDQRAKTICLLQFESSSGEQKGWHHQCAREGFERAVREAQASGCEVEGRLHTMPSPADGHPPGEASQVHPYHAAGYLAMHELIRAGQVPDAILFSSDNNAHGALLACTEAGIRVPEDLMVAGFHDHPVSSVGSVSLTSVREPVAEMVRLAFEDLIPMIGGEKRPLRKVALPCELVVRRSTLREG